MRANMALNDVMQITKPYTFFKTFFFFFKFLPYARGISHMKPYTCFTDASKRAEYEQAFTVDVNWLR